MDTNTYTTHSGIQVHEGLLAEQCVDNNLYRGIKKSSLEIPEKTVDNVDLGRHYQLFCALLYSDNFTGNKVQSIRKKIKILCGYIHGSSWEYEPSFIRKLLINKTNSIAIEELFSSYLKSKKYLKYDPEIALISTWIRQYVYLNINNLLRKFRPRSESEGPNTRRDIFAPCNANFRTSFEELEDWYYMGSVYENPETLLQQKELEVLALAHFGERDLRVLLGIDSKQDVILRHKLNYDQYTKLLYLKKRTFVKVVKSNGYDH